MEAQQPISIMIHDLNPWGGQDRSMLEIAWQMNRTFPLEIHSFSLEGGKEWRDMKHFPYEATLKKPVVFKYLSYQKQSRKNLNPKSVVQSTGTASLVSDIVQVQFLHHEWLKIQEGLPKDKSPSPHLFRGLYHQWLSKYKLYMEKQSYTAHKNYVAISHGIKKQLIEHFSIPKDQISVIHHGVDTEAFCPFQENEMGAQVRQTIRSNHGFTDSDVVLLHVGALNARKGIFKTLELMALLKKESFNNIHFLAVGQGDQKIIQSKVEELDIADRVHLVSHTKSIRDYYWASDLFFFPTFYEPFGLVILEALSSGLPVLTTTVAGASELMTNEPMGALFAPESTVETIAEKVTPYLRSAELRQEAGLNGRKMALGQTWEKVGKKYRRFYRDYFRETL